MWYNKYGDKEMESAYRLFNISPKLEEISRKSEEEIKDIFKQIEETALYNQARVLKAFQNVPIGQVHFTKTTGYGHGDIGREAIEKVYAEVFDAQDALVRVQFVSGTHTIATALKGILIYEFLLTLQDLCFFFLLENIVFQLHHI